MTFNQKRFISIERLANQKKCLTSDLLKLGADGLISVFALTDGLPVELYSRAHGNDDDFGANGSWTLEAGSLTLEEPVGIYPASLEIYLLNSNATLSRFVGDGPHSEELQYEYRLTPGAPLIRFSDYALVTFSLKDGKLDELISTHKVNELAKSEVKLHNLQRLIGLFSIACKDLGGPKFRHGEGPNQTTIATYLQDIAEKNNYSSQGLGQSAIAAAIKAGLKLLGESASTEHSDSKLEASIKK